MCMYFKENVFYKLAVRFSLLGIAIFYFVLCCLKRKKNNFYSSLRQMLDETSVCSKDEVRRESRPAWERHTGGDGCGGVRELNGT